MALAGFYILGVIACVILNLLVVVVLVKKGREINYIDVVMVSMAASDLLQAGIGYTVEIYSMYKEDRINDTLCKVAGFSVTFLALVSIAHLVGIAVERYITLKFPMRARGWADKPSIGAFVIIPSWLYGFIWGVFPLVGWSSYEHEEGDEHRCGIDLANKDSAYVAYSYNLLVWCFILPLVVIAFCCYSIWGALKSMRDQGEALGLPAAVLESRKQLEKRQSTMSLVLIGAFLVAWSPYAICVFVLTASGNVPPDLLSFASVFAKCSTLYNPVIYSIFMDDFRVRLKKLFGCYSPPLQMGASTASTATVNQPVSQVKMSQVKASADNV